MDNQDHTTFNTFQKTIAYNFILHFTSIYKLNEFILQKGIRSRLYVADLPVRKLY